LADGTLSEHNFPVEMPNLKGAGAEFIPNTNLSHYTNEVINLNEITATEFVIGHLYGGIQSPTINAFTNNQTTTTSADPTIYEVKLVYNPSLNVATMEGKNPFTFSVSPNPTNDDTVRIQFNLPYVATLDYFITSLDGKMLDDGEIDGLQVGNNAMNFSLENAKEKIVIITFILDNKFYASQKVIRNQ
jgi:hypothetical protein